MDDQATNRTSSGSMINIADSTCPDFSGKVLRVCTVRLPDDVALIENPKLETQAGRVFITGRMASIGGPENVTRGLPVAIAWDLVESYVVYDSAAQYLQRHKEYWEDQPPTGFIQKLWSMATKNKVPTH